MCFYTDTVTHVNLGDRKLILGRVDRQRLYLLKCQTDRISGEDGLSLSRDELQGEASLNLAVFGLCAVSNGSH